MLSRTVSEVRIQVADQRTRRRLAETRAEMVTKSPVRCDSIKHDPRANGNNLTPCSGLPGDAPDLNLEMLTDSKAPSAPAEASSEPSQSQQHPTTLDRLRLFMTWAPKNCRYDTNDPPKFSLSLNLLFALVRLNSVPQRITYQRLVTNCTQAGTITVANLYYVQPILYKIADTFDVSFEKASSVATMQQAGYAFGLLLLCPLGDIFRRRQYILALVMFTATMVRLLLCETQHRRD